MTSAGRGRAPRASHPSCGWPGPRRLCGGATMPRLAGAAGSCAGQTAWSARRGATHNKRSPTMFLEGGAAWDGQCKNVPAQGVWRLQRVLCRTLRARNRPHPENWSWQTLSVCQWHVATAAKLESLWAILGSSRFRRGPVVSPAPDRLRQGTASRPISRANLPPVGAGRGRRQSRPHPAAAP